MEKSIKMTLFLSPTAYMALQEMMDSPHKPRTHATKNNIVCIAIIDYYKREIDKLNSDCS